MDFVLVGRVMTRCQDRSVDGVDSLQDNGNAVSPCISAVELVVITSDCLELRAGRRKEKPVEQERPLKIPSIS